ncbi:hypothetical protein ACJMQP_11655 [Rhodopseudomonas palustris]
MTLEEARAKFNTAYAAYQSALVTQTLEPISTNSPPPTFVGRITASIANVYSAVVGLTPAQAKSCVNCSIECVYKLAQASGDSDELEKYADDMIVLTNELTAIIAKQWGNNNYEPVTAALRGAKERLTKVKKDADELADSLNLAADLLSGFGRLLAVLK